LLYQDHLSQIWLCEITGLRGVLLSSTPLLALAGFREVLLDSKDDGVKKIEVSDDQKNYPI